MKIIRLLITIVLMFFLCSSCYTKEENGDWWYKTQMGTGPGNCGPASAAMAVQWSTSKNITVQKARNVIGWPAKNGGIAPFHISLILKYFNVPHKIVDTVSIENIDKYLSEGNIVIILFNTKTISKTDGSKYGRTYNDSVGHYIVLYKSYRDFWVVNDPMQGGDGRLYSKKEIFKSIYPEIVIIWREYKK
jgi:hypothetical protein